MQELTTRLLWASCSEFVEMLDRMKGHKLYLMVNGDRFFLCLQPRTAGWFEIRAKCHMWAEHDGEMQVQYEVEIDLKTINVYEISRKRGKIEV